MISIKVTSAPNNNIKVFADINGHSILQTFPNTTSSTDIVSSLFDELESDLSELEMELTKKAYAVFKKLYFDDDV